MITEQQIQSGEVKEGSKVFYTRKDGSRIYGTVISIYVEQKKMCVKPDVPLKTGGKLYSTSFRFRRLTLGNAADIFGTQVAPLALLAAQNDKDDIKRNIFSVGEGLMAMDENRMYVEKTSRLKEGIFKASINNQSVIDCMAEQIREQNFNSDSIKGSSEAQSIVDMYLTFKHNTSGTPSCVIKIEDSKLFNRFIKDIVYTWGYYSKNTDEAILKVDEDKLCVRVLDKSNKEFKGAECLVSNCGINAIIGTFEGRLLLRNLKDFVRGIRSKRYDIQVCSDKIMLIETIDQRHYQCFKRDIVVAKESEQNGNEIDRADVSVVEATGVEKRREGSITFSRDGKRIQGVANKNSK